MSSSLALPGGWPCCGASVRNEVEIKGNSATKVGPLAALPIFGRTADAVDRARMDNMTGNEASSKFGNRTNSNEVELLKR